MSSARPDHIKDLERRISDLRDELQLQNAIHQSLQTIQYDPSRAQQLVDSEVQIDKLTKQLSDVRRAHHQGTFTCTILVCPVLYFSTHWGC